MGDPKKPHKQYNTPKNTWSTDQIARELWLVGKYGLRNKRELWIAETELSRIRSQARKLLAESMETRIENEQILLKSLTRKGIIGASPTLDDVLGLVVENLLERRLQSIVMSKGLLPSIQAARQAITHGHIMVDDRRVTIPGFIVLLNKEPTVRLVEGSSLAKIMVETPSSIPTLSKEEL